MSDTLQTPTQNTVLDVQATEVLTAPPVDTPVVEPAPSVTTEQAPELQQQPVNTPESLGYEQSTDVTISGIVSILADAGITAEQSGELFKAALETGNPEDIDEAAILAALPKTGALVIAAAKGKLLELQANNVKIKDAFFNAVGGEGPWSHIQAWIKAKESSDPAFKLTIDNYRTLVGKSEADAVLVANALKGMYSEATVSRAPNLVRPGIAPTPSYIGVTDLADFGRKYSEAIRNGDINRANAVLAAKRATLGN